MSKSKVKSMLYIVFDCKGVVHIEFLPPDETVIAVRYVIVLERVQKRVCRFLETLSWLRHNIYHIACVVKDYLVKHHVLTLPKPNHSPDVPGTSFSSPTTQTGYETTEPRLNSGHSWRGSSFRFLRSRGPSVTGKVTENAVLTQTDPTLKTIKSIYRCCQYVSFKNLIWQLSGRTLY